MNRSKSTAPLTILLNFLLHHGLGRCTYIQPRIVGGRSISILDCPYQAALEHRNGSMYFCSGAIINHGSILTAAHCLHQFAKKPSSIQVRVGSSTQSKDGRVFQVNTVTIHPNFDSSSDDYDVGIVKLKTMLRFSRRVRASQLPSTRVTIGMRCTISGWGSSEENGSPEPYLLQAVVTTIDPIVCNDEYKHFGFMDLTPRMLCAEGLVGVNRMDACQGDSGAPLVCNNTVYGLVSWGLGCSEPGRPGIYTNISSLLEWIQNNTAVSLDI